MLEDAPQTITWAALVAAEPALQAVADACAAVDGSDPHFCANAVWYGEVESGDGSHPRATVTQLVGWARKARRQPPAWLWSETAYNVAYHHCYDLLPDCRDCFCANLADIF